MSRLHLVDDLGLGTPETDRLQRFALDRTTDLQRSLTVTPGLWPDPAGQAWRVRSDEATQNLRINAGRAYDAAGQLLALREDARALAIPLPDTWYWVAIRYRTSVLEEGTVDVAADGSVTGKGTRFTETLRGEPDHASRVRFFLADDVAASALGTSIFSVLDVLSDTALVLNTTAPLPTETALRYAVVGTYTPGAQIDPADLFPFRYDAVEISLVAETSANVAPALPGGNIPGMAFWLARVRRTTSPANVDVHDKRPSSYQLSPATIAAPLPLQGQLPQHNGIGVERVTWDAATSPRDENLVTVGWGLIATGWSFNAGELTLAIEIASGGRWIAVADINDGELDGWRLYPDGKAAWLRVLSSVKTSPTTLRLTLAAADPDLLATPGAPLTLVPDAEQVLLQITNIDSPALQLRQPVLAFPVSQGRATFPLPVTAALQRYELRWAFQTGPRRSAWRLLPSGQAFLEDQFTAQGALRVGITPTRTALPSGRLTLTQAEDAYTRFRTAITTGDFFGIEHRLIETATPVIELRVGVAKSYQVITTPLDTDNQPTSLTLAQDQVIELRPFLGTGTAPARGGNNYLLHLRGDITLAGNTLRITQGYQNPSDPGLVLKTLGVPELRAMRSAEGLLIRATYDDVHPQGPRWLIYTMLAGGTNGELGEIKLLGPMTVDGAPFNPLTEYFNLSDGRGLAGGAFEGWALADGRNGTTDLRGAVPMGYDYTDAPTPTDSIGQYNPDGTLATNAGALGNTGGTHEVELDVNQIPPHEHEITNEAGITAGNIMVFGIAGNQGNNSQPTNSEAPGWGGGNMKAAARPGSTYTHENRMKYVVVAYVQRIA